MMEEGWASTRACQPVRAKRQGQRRAVLVETTAKAQLLGEEACLEEFTQLMHPMPVSSSYGML